MLPTARSGSIDGRLRWWFTHSRSGAKGNDPRGIDVAVLSKLPIQNIRTNIHQRVKNSSKNLFSRDCLEVEFKLPDGKSLWVLQNHLLSKLRKKNDARRKVQAAGVRQILRDRYDLGKDLVIVAGDLNDDIDNDPLSPLASLPKLQNALDVLSIPKDEQWTYYYGREKSKDRIDFVLVSEALAPLLKAGGVDRRGIAGIDKLTSGQTKPMSGITNWRNAASDHAAVWIEFDT